MFAKHLNLVYSQNDIEKYIFCICDPKYQIAKVHIYLTDNPSKQSPAVRRRGLSSGPGINLGIVHKHMEISTRLNILAY